MCTSLRRKLILFAIVCSIFAWRWTTVKPLLSESWTADSQVRYTALILEEPTLTDSKTVIYQGRWKLVLSGFPRIEMGRRYRFVGKVEETVLLGKQVRIEMLDPIFDEVAGTELLPIERAVIALSGRRERMVDNLTNWLPEPHSSLAAGILLGVARQMPWEFYQQLVNSGTLHIVAASGYNVTVVARVLMGMALLLVSRGWAVVVGVAGIGLYMVLAGGSAAVVRAGIMASLTLSAYYWGRPAEARRLLWVAAGIMLLAQPLMLVDTGFQLSVSATAGLLYLEPWLRGKLGRGKGWGSRYAKEYWWPTVAATLATMPVLYLTFGRVSWISPLPNLVILPLVPLIMLLSSMAVGAGGVAPGLGQVVAYFLYVPLYVMVEVIRLFG